MSPTRRAQVSGFSLTEGRHPAGTSLPWHSHDRPTICVVLRGAFTETSAGTALRCRPGMLKFMPAGERHCNDFDQGVRGMLIEVDPARAAQLQRVAPVLDDRVHFEGGLLAALGRRVYDELRTMDASSPLAIEGLLLELLATASRTTEPKTSRTPPPWLHEARDIIHAELGERPTLAGIAERVGVHPVTLARGFRAAFGCTVGEYVRRHRLEVATSQLARTDRSIAEIALAAGFSDQSHFSNLFRQRLGISPAHYRRAVGQS